MTAKEARDALKMFQSYVERNFNDPSVLEMCDKFDDIMAEESFKKIQQSHITDFFKPV